jgi:DNA-binding transcriptional LysR family regulator
MLGTVSELDLRLIRVFLAVVEAGGVSAAQTALNTTQPTISAQLATLEARVGFRLCERGRGGFSVTPKGSQFVDAARRLLAAAEGFRVEVQHINRKVSGTINIGLRSQHEGLYFHFTELSSSLLEEKIINSHIDLAIGYFWHRLPSIDYFPLFEETQIAYCAPSHPLSEQAGALTQEDVSHYDWVWPSHPLPEMPAPTSIERLTVLTDSMDGAALLILSGQHLGFLPQHYAARHEQLGQLRPLNPELLRYEVSFHAAVRHSARRRDLVSAFLHELTDIFASAQAPQM